MEIKLKGFYLSVKGYPFALISIDKRLRKVFFNYKGIYDIEGSFFTEEQLKKIDELIKGSEEKYAEMVFKECSQNEYGKKIALWDRYYNFTNRNSKKKNARVSRYRYSKLFK